MASFGLGWGFQTLQPLESSIHSWVDCAIDALELIASTKRIVQLQSSAGTRLISPSHVLARTTAHPSRTHCTPDYTTVQRATCFASGSVYTACASAVVRTPRPR